MSDYYDFNEIEERELGAIGLKAAATEFDRFDVMNGPYDRRLQGVIRALFAADRAMHEEAKRVAAAAGKEGHSPNDPVHVVASLIIGGGDPGNYLHPFNNYALAILALIDAIKIHEARGNLAAAIENAGGRDYFSPYTADESIAAVDLAAKELSE